MQEPLEVLRRELGNVLPVGLVRKVGAFMRHQGVIRDWPVVARIPRELGNVLPVGLVRKVGAFAC